MRIVYDRDPYPVRWSLRQWCGRNEAKASPGDCGLRETKYSSDIVASVVSNAVRNPASTRHIQDGEVRIWKSGQV